MSIIYGDFGNKDSSLKHKVNIALNKVADSNEPNTEQSFLLIVDTGVDFKILSDVELPEFNIMLDIVKFTVLEQEYSFLEDNK